MNLVREVMDYITEQDPEVGKALEEIAEGKISVLEK